MNKLLTCFLILFASGLFAQDTIVKMDSTRVVAIVKEVSDKKIKYVRHNNPDGPVYEVSRIHVARIIYADGTRETYGTTADEEISGSQKNIVALTTSDVISGVGTIYYERLIGSDMGLRLVTSMGALGVSGKVPDYYGGNYYNRYKLFSTGIDIHYYAYRGNRLSYYVGSLIEYGRVRKRDYWYDYPYPYPYPASRIEDYAFVGITNGLTIHSNKFVNIDLYTSVGWSNNFQHNGNDISARLGLSVGYRF